LETKQRGVTPAVLAVIVIVIIAVVAVAAILLLRGGGAPGGLPEYPGSSRWDIPSEYQQYLPQGMDVAGYTVNATVQEVVNWYKSNMTGWDLQTEMSGILIYKKGDTGAEIIAMDGTLMGQSGTVYVLATAPWSTIGAT